jgi:hypothetical protein
MPAKMHKNTHRVRYLSKKLKLLPARTANVLVCGFFELIRISLGMKTLPED